MQEPDGNGKKNHAEKGKDEGKERRAKGDCKGRDCPDRKPALSRNEPLQPTGEEEGRIVVVPFCWLLALLPIAYCLLPIAYCLLPIGLIITFHQNSYDLTN